GEFAFVVFGEASRVGLLDDAMRDRLVAVVGLSMAATPLLVMLVLRFAPAAGGNGSQRAFDDIPDDHPQVLIAGFGRFGQIVARLLWAQKTPFIAIDPDVEQVDFFRRFGSQIYYGDPTHPEILRSAGAARVKVFVVAIDGVEASLAMVRLLRSQYPDALVLARARDRRHAWQLMDLGARAFRELFGSSLEMGREVLVALGVDARKAEDRVRRFRSFDLRLLDQQRQLQGDEAALIQSTRDARRELVTLFEADTGGG